MNILEVGCGTGFLSRLIAKKVDDVHIVGLEKDEKTLKLGEEMVDRERLTKRITLRKGDAYEIPFPDASFDLVTSQTVL